MTFSGSHVAAFLLGVAGTVGVVMVNSPRVPVYSPALRQLQARNVALTDSLTRSDSAAALYRRRLASRDTALAVIERREASALRLSQGYARLNRALADSLAKAHPELSPALNVIRAGIASQDSACTAAANDCAMVKDSLRVQLGERDSIATDNRRLTDGFASLSRQAITADSLAERKQAHTQRVLTLTRIGAIALIALALLK